MKQESHEFIRGSVKSGIWIESINHVNCGSVKMWWKKKKEETLPETLERIEKKVLTDEQLKRIEIITFTFLIIGLLVVLRMTP